MKLLVAIIAMKVIILWHESECIDNIMFSYQPSSTSIQGKLAAKILAKDGTDMYHTYDQLTYNRMGQRFYYTHCHFNIPREKPIE